MNMCQAAGTRRRFSAVKGSAVASSKGVKVEMGWWFDATNSSNAGLPEREREKKRKEKKATGMVLVLVLLLVLNIKQELCFLIWSGTVLPQDPL